MSHREHLQLRLAVDLVILTVRENLLQVLVILDDAVERARTRLEYTTLATAFCGAAFTIGDLRNVHETVWDVRLDSRNFSRKAANSDGFVQPTGARRMPETGRPAALYRRGPAQVLSPPLLRNPAS